MGGICSDGGNLKSLFKGQILFLGGFFQFGHFCVREILNLYFGVKFFLFKGIFKLYEEAFLILRVIFLLGVKLLNFVVGVIFLGRAVNFKVGCYFKTFSAKTLNLGAN